MPEPHLSYVRVSDTCPVHVCMAACQSVLVYLLFTPMHDAVHRYVRRQTVMLHTETAGHDPWHGVTTSH